MHSTTDRPAAVLDAAAAQVLESDLTRLSDDEITELLRTLEHVNRTLAAITTKVIVDVVERSIPRRAGCTSTASYLVEVLRLSRPDASARVTAATLLGTWHDVGGYPISVDLPATSAAQQDGVVSVEHARRIASVTTRIPAGLPRVHRVEAETILADCARTGTPEEVEKAGDRLLVYLDPDGKLTDDRDRRRRRGIRIGTQGADLMSPISGEIDPTLRALLDALLGKHARPGMNNPDDPTSPATGTANPTDIANAATRDTRTAAQRNHDALKAICAQALRFGDDGTHRGLPVTPIVTMTLDQLEAAAGVATTGSGGRIPVSDALKMAEQVRPWLAIFDHTGRPLHLGRAHRLARLEQRLVLIPFDRGCTRPGCDKPPTLCAVHHPDEWADGGETDIENETFACDSCHALIGNTDTGWRTVKAGPDHPHPGRTLWIPPKHIDPEQQPRINHGHHPEELLHNAIEAAERKRADDP